jgi:hypothetical protein
MLSFFAQLTVKEELSIFLPTLHYNVQFILHFPLRTRDFLQYAEYGLSLLKVS